MATTRRSRCSSSSRRACPAARFCSSTNTSQPTGKLETAETECNRCFAPYGDGSSFPIILSYVFMLAHTLLSHTYIITTAAARQATTITLMTTHPFRTATGLPWCPYVPLPTLRTDRETRVGQSNSGIVPRSPFPPRARALPPHQHPSQHQSLCPPMRPRWPLPQQHLRLRLRLPSMATDAAPGVFLGVVILQTNLKMIGAMRMQANAKGPAVECGFPRLRRLHLPPGHLLRAPLRVQRHQRGLQPQGPRRL